ncbi:MAG TPA: hypothetical protein VHW46_03210 [Terracidiphilus sp.]|jgi:hypothetical protein|nr:hypothetical protein [Terracidiphilus sp.]
MDETKFHQASGSPEAFAQDARQEQLLTLVGELLTTNQELRFKLAQVEREAERATRAAKESSAVYRMLLP